MVRKSITFYWADMPKRRKYLKHGAIMADGTELDTLAAAVRYYRKPEPFNNLKNSSTYGSMRSHDQYDEAIRRLEEEDEFKNDEAAKVREADRK
jgi:hypothetical protein